MVSFYDYLNIAFYLAFIVGVGVYFLKRSKDTSDYFRGGGVMPWWVTGAMAWMSSFSAWVFTGAAGKVYETGPYVLCLYYAGILPLLSVLFYTSYRFRRMRVITPFEAVRLRFGAGSQQFYTWIRLPFLLLFSGVGLNAVGVFIAAVLGVDLVPVLFGMGLLVTIMAMLGGSLGVAASDFVQMFLVVTVTLVTAFLALARPDIGGVTGLIAKVPDVHFEWGALARPEFVVLWVIALTLNNFIGNNSMENSSRFLMAASDRHARMTLVIPLLGTLFGPLIWIVPPMVAAVLHPDLHQLFPNLRYPNEAAFLATALDVLPQGMLGLLICGIIAATVTSMDAGLNQGAGIFVRNFYLPVINPQCPEKKLLIISKICTAVFGLIIVGVAVIVSQYRTLGLFDLVNQLGISLLLPLAIPLFLGLFYSRTPRWSTWSTVLIGLGASFVVKFFLKPEMLASLPGMQGPFKPEEVTTFYIFATVAVVGGVGIAWFFFTSLFYEREPEEFKAVVSEFFEQMRTPVLRSESEVKKEDHGVALSIGRLCLIYGGFVLLLMLIPNSLTGRLCFGFCGGVMWGMGLILSWIYRKK